MECAVLKKDGTIERDKLEYVHLDCADITAYSILWSMGVLGNTFKQDKNEDFWNVEYEAFDYWKRFFQGLSELDKRIEKCRNAYGRKRVNELLRDIEHNDLFVYIKMKHDALDALENKQNAPVAQFDGL